jgi:hypothetical protein
MALPCPYNFKAAELSRQTRNPGQRAVGKANIFSSAILLEIFERAESLLRAAGIATQIA